LKNTNSNTRLLAFLIAIVIILSFSGQVFAVDDGARAYWMGREGTQGVSFQYLRLDIDASGTQQFAPGQYIYPNADIEANVFIANWVYFMTLFNRPSSLAVNLAGGDISADVNTKVPLQFLPPGIQPNIAFSQSSSGFADPSMQLVVNLFGTPPMRSNFDLLNYEPTLTLAVAVMLAFPIGEYDDDKLVNIGLNRWFGRIAFPIKYHFGVFDPGHMSSIELVPSVWLFDENDDFVGQKLENDPLWQLEAHLTHDFTTSFWGSLDLLYRSGFQSEINGVEVGDDLDIGDLGFTFNFQATDNLAIRAFFSSNVFGDNDLDNSLIRIQFTYVWHPETENIKRLRRGH
jgi:hypothetical protein